MVTNVQRTSITNEKLHFFRARSPLRSNQVFEAFFSRFATLNLPLFLQNLKELPLSFHKPINLPLFISVNDSLSVIYSVASFELVYVTYVRTPENFFVQRCADKERLQHMMHNLNKYCRNSDKPDDLIFCAEKGRKSDYTGCPKKKFRRLMEHREKVFEPNTFYLR